MHIYVCVHTYYSLCLHAHVFPYSQLGIGKMYHCPRRSHGVLVKGDARNMFFRKDCSYQRMLEKCITEVYTEEERENAEFYIADSCGIPIWSSDTIKIDDDNGTEELEWTLNLYIHLSNAKYPSKVRYYCVRKGRWYYCTVILVWPVNMKIPTYHKN